MEESSAEKETFVTCFKLDDSFDLVLAALTVDGDELKIRKLGTLTSELNELSTHPGDLNSKYK